jgi:predicted metalloprotease
MVKLRRTGSPSGNLIDRRGARGAGGVAAGGGIVGIIVVVLMSLLGGGGGGGGIDITDILGQFEQAPASVDEADEPLVEEMSLALDDIQAFWSTDQGLGTQYRDAKLVLFQGGVSTGGCGNAPSSVGPFYCPADEQAYIDLSFFKELDARFGAPGDFARVYVLAHELGHHVQNVLGTSAQVDQARQQDPGGANEASVRLELQADCYAGVWGNSAKDRGLLEPGDIEEGLDAAAAVGDDSIQEQAGMEVNPESWTHGSSESRMRWFTTGFDSGDPNSCDTFAVAFDQL